MFFFSRYASRVSVGMSDHNCRPPTSAIPLYCFIDMNYLLEVDDRLPELVLCLVEISHADFTEVSRMVFVDVRSVMMLTTSHTTTTGMFSVLSYSSVTR